MTEIYSLDSLLLNGKTVTTKHIIDGNLKGNTDFEKETLLFLNEWLTGKESFHINTSGSTGPPKIITISREQMMLSARATIDALNLLPGTTALVCLHTRYIAGKMMLVRAILNQMKIVAVEPSSNPIENLPQDIEIHFAALVPLQLKVILESRFSYRLNRIRDIIVGGAAVSASLRQKIVSMLHTNVYATYGMTETITHIALQKMDKAAQENVFTVLPGVSISMDERGCLVVGSEYLKEPVISNDLVEIFGQDKFRWLGRIDHVINSGGIKVIPEQVEKAVDEAMKTLGIERRFFVTGQSHEFLGEKVVLFIEGEKLDDEIEESIYNELTKKLSPYELPKEMTYRHSFFFTETGKINISVTIASTQ